MSIVKGLEPGAILFKFEYESYRYVFNQETRVQDKVPRTCYGYVELYTRRARTNGAYIGAPLHYLVPFLNALGIKLIKQGFDRDSGMQNYVAVGCNIRTVTEEQYQTIEINEIAQKHQEKKIKNSQFYEFLMDNNTVTTLKENLLLTEQKYKEPIQDDIWPDERPYAFYASPEPIVRPLWTDMNVDRVVRYGGIR